MSKSIHFVTMRPIDTPSIGRHTTMKVNASFLLIPLLLFLGRLRSPL